MEADHHAFMLKKMGAIQLRFSCDLAAIQLPRCGLLAKCMLLRKSVDCAA